MKGSREQENEFITGHQDEDTAKLLLQRKRWPDLDLDLMVNTIEGRKRIRKKLPSWYDQIGLRYPDRLCTEQCSSEETARYKAEIIKGLGARRIADLTGGLGVDCWAFAHVTEAVLHNEMKPYLSEAVQENMEILLHGAAGSHFAEMHFSEKEITPENIGEVLDDFQPDVVFMDPARRDEVGKKVFLIEDCRPDVLKLKDLIFERCEYIVLKLSPMADIRMVVERLGNVRDLYVISAEGECKELLIVMEKDWQEDYRLHIKEGDRELLFDPHQEASSPAVYFPDKTSLEAQQGAILFEPGKSLTKAGLFQTICNRFNLKKLGRSTHLYLDPLQQEGTVLPVPGNDYTPFGKCFRIREILVSGNKTIKYLSKTYPQAEVTARNLPITSEALRKKLHCTSGGDLHIFAAKVDTSAGSGDYYFVTERIKFQ